MKKILFVLAVLCYGIQLQAATSFKADTIKKDTAKTNKQIKELTFKLSELQTQLTNAQNQIPLDSTKMENYISKSNDELAKSKQTANSAVGGDVSDAKKAQKQAKKAANASDDANDAKKQLDKDRKKVTSLQKDIANTQAKLDKLKAM